MEFLLIWRSILKWKWLALLMFLVFFIPVLIVTHMVTPSYRTIAKVLVDTSGARSSLLLTLGINNDVSVAGNEEHNNEIALAMTRPVIDELIRTLDLRNRRGLPCRADEITGFSIRTKFSPQPMISVSQFEDSDLVQIKAQSPNPEEAANMANTLAAIFTSNTVQRVRTECAGIRQFIDTQLADVSAQYRSSLVQEQSLHETSGVLDVGAEIQNILSLQKDLNDLEVGLAKIGTEYTKEHPDYQEALMQIEASRQLIAQAAKKIPSQQKEFAELAAKTDAMAETYKSLLQFRTQMGMAEVMVTSNVRLVDPAAVPVRPSFPNKPIMYSVGIIFGCFWTLGIVLLVEYIAAARRDDLKTAGKAA